MRVMLTGGAGFIGSHVAEHLLGHGHEVAVVDNLSSGKHENVPKETEFYEADIRSGCTEVFQEFQPQALCHQAAQMDVRRFSGWLDSFTIAFAMAFVRLSLPRPAELSTANR